MGLVGSVCIDVPVNAIAMLHSKSVLCLVCGSLDEIESVSKYSSPEVSSDCHLIWIISFSLGLLSELGVLKVPLHSVMVGAELG